MNTNKAVYCSCKDYTVSNEIFDLVYDEKYDMLITEPKPHLGKLASYYKSENYISHTDGNTSFFEKIYQKVKKYTIHKKIKLIASFKVHNKTLLDVGCGTGDFLLAAKKRNWKICGIEPNQNARKLAEKKLGEQAVLKSDLDEIRGQKFDVITLWHVLEHVPDLDNYILELKRMLKSNGVLIIAVPNYKSFDAKFYKQYWAAFDVPRHLWHFSKKAIATLFKEKSMKVKKILPMYFDAFYVSILSEQYKHYKGNILRAFFIGCLSNFKAWRSKEYSSLIYIIQNK